MTLHDIEQRRRRATDPTPVEQRRIKFDGTINLGHVLTTVGFVATIISTWQMMDKRVMVLEEARIVQAATDHRQDNEISDNKKTVREDLKDISTKLDRLIERKP